MSHVVKPTPAPRLPVALAKPGFLARQSDQQPFAWIRFDHQPDVLQPAQAQIPAVVALIH
ncbi:hypothetical protein [Chitinolyticbacter albus]|uniref:hypothetical protein n=1 Tax=Chitinolyticbacter albus TaxID=2961951 RepID=UPI00210B6A11|nr:hypothetical protein [Chitinolyticbacter albus]